MSEAYKKYTALIFAAALAAGTATAANADTLHEELLSEIPEIACRVVYERIEDIPDFEHIPELNVTVVPQSGDYGEIMAERIGDRGSLLTVSFDFPAEAGSGTEAPQTSDTPDLPGESSDTADTPDTAETSDTPDAPETKDEPLKETASPLENAPEQQKRRRIGDVDSDGSVNSNDALLTLRTTLFGDMAPAKRESADVDGDGALTSFDALDILRFSSGFSSLYIGKDAAVPESSVRWFKDENGNTVARLEGGEAPEGIVNIGGFDVGFGKGGVLLTGSCELDGTAYSFTENGVLVNGWQDTEDGSSLFVNGSPIEGWNDSYGQTFFFSGHTALTGWQELDGKKCYFDENGAAAKGFAIIGGKSYYFDDSLDNKTGLIEVGGRLYMMYEDGGHAEGWTTIDGKLYYFKENGASAKGIETIDEESYFFENDSTFETGFLKRDFGTIYKDDYGFQQFGFLCLNGSYYYFADNGAMATGSLTISGASFLFGDDGVMITGWYRSGDSRGYLLNGQKVKGAARIDDQDYYFENDAFIHTGFYQNNDKLYYKNENGVNQTGWQEIDGETYYFLEDGTAAEGLVTIGEKLYCFENGAMLRNTTFGLYRIIETGECIKLTTVDASTVKYKADDIISQIGTDPNELCHYVNRHVFYYFVNEPMVYNDPYSADWARIAAFAVNKGYGACYHYSAFLHVLFQRAGLTSRIVVGTGYYPSLHSYNELLVNGEWVVYDALYDTCGASIGYMQSLGYTLDNFITYSYD